MMENVGIIGAGSLGTSLAQVVAPNVQQVTIFARRTAIVEDIIKNHQNSEYYPHIHLKSNITAKVSFTWDKDPEIIFFCVPSSAVRETCQILHKEHEDLSSIIVSTAKGIEYPSLLRMSQIIEEIISIKPIVFSGPTFASEMISHLPTAVTLAGDDVNKKQKVREAIVSEFFHVEMSKDVTGVEFCSILKNIYSIAFGICEGIDINENARYAIFTRSFQEMKNILENIGGEAATADCYCGFGDLTLTSASRKSRNYTLGLLYGKKIAIDEKSSGILFEGKKSILGIKQLCIKNGITTPVLDFVHDIVINKVNSHLAFRNLWHAMELIP